MPFIDGKRVSNAEWLRSRNDHPVDWKEALGYNDGSEPEAEAPVADEKPKRKPRGKTKKAQAEAALAAVAGLDIDLDETDEVTTDGENADTENE